MNAIGLESEMASNDDIQRDLGSITARLDEHDRQLGELRKEVREGFEALSAKISELFAAENRRRGMLGLLKMLVTGGALTGVAEFLRSIFTHHGQ